MNVVLTKSYYCCEHHRYKFSVDMSHSGLLVLHVDIQLVGGVRDSQHNCPLCNKYAFIFAVIH